MPATLNYVAATGAVTYTGSDGVNNSLTITVVGGEARFTDTGEGVTVTGDTTGWSVTAGNSARTSTNAINTIATALGTGTNVLNIAGQTAPITHTATGTDTINISGNAPTNTANSSTAPSVSVNSSAGGAVTVFAQQWSVSSGDTMTISASGDTVTGHIGPSGASTLTVTASGGTVSNVTLSGSAAACTRTWTINNPNWKLTAGTSTTNGTNTFNIKAFTVASTIFTSGNGNDTFNIGTSAGSSAGCDGLTVAFTVAANIGSNTLNISDAGSATGGNTYTLASSTASGFAGGTITPTAVGGSYSSATFTSSSVGGNTFKWTANPSTSTYSNGQIVVGSGTDTLDLSSLSGYSVANSGGSGTVTLSNGKTITYSGIATFVPALVTGRVGLIGPGLCGASVLIGNSRGGLI